MGVVTRDVKSISKSGEAKLKGDVTLSEGSNITLTQSGQDIEIAASGAAGGVDTANSPQANEYARFTDADTIEGRTAAEAKADLDLEVGTDLQAFDAGLTDIAGLAVTDGNIIVGDGANWVAESGATARTSLGLGSIATQAANNVSITGGSVTGITDLAVADGGTGASTAAAARTNLGTQAKVFYTVGAADADYITDGTADDVQIQEALDAAAAAGGGTVFIKEGTYAIAAAMTIGSNTKVMGDGFSTILQHVAGAGFNGLFKNEDQTNGNSGIIICDLAIDGNAANVTGSDPRDTIWLKEVWDSKVMRCYIYDSVDSAIVLDSTLTVDNQVSDNIIDGAIDIGIYVSAASKAIVTNNTVRNTGSYGIRLITTGNKECIVANNRVFNCGQTSSVDGITVATSGGENNLIIGNHVTQSGRMGLFVNTVAYTSIIGNYFTLNDQRGIQITGTGRGVITGNLCHANGQATTNTYSGIYLNNATDFTVTGNRCGDTGSGTRQKYGIEEAGTADGNVIVGNQCDRNGTGAVLILGANTQYLANQVATANKINGTLAITGNTTPNASDGAALGTSSLMWSDLFLASGAVVNFNNGDVTLTHSADTLTVGGGTLATGALTSSTIVASGLVTAQADLVVNETAYFDAEVDNGNSGASKTLDFTVGNKQKITLTDNCTFTFTAPGGPCNLILKLVQDGTGSRNPTWPATVKWAGGAEPTWSTAADAVDIVSFYYDGTNYYGAANTGFA